MLTVIITMQSLTSGQPRIFLRPALVAAALLLVPFTAMQFTSEVDWTLSDFIIMGILLFVTGLMIELALRKADRYRVGAAVIIVALFLWFWAELAVGVFTNWGN